MTKMHSLFEPVAPTAEESQVALDASRRLAALVTPDTDSLSDSPSVDSRSLTLRIGTGNGTGNGTNDNGSEGQGEPVTLPLSALPLLTRLLAELGQGHAVALLPVETELSTQQAADLLNVSRPFLIGLLEQRRLPARKVGKHRRVLLRDVLDYKRRDEARRHAILDELTAEAQELGLGY